MGVLAPISLNGNAGDDSLNGDAGSDILNGQYGSVKDNCRLGC
ncbi:hypothetical protein [Nostoc sp. DSM 114167]